MTQNQIAYLGLKENIRHNKASEQISSGSLSESARHNLETEAVNWFSARNLERYQEKQAQAALAQAGASYAHAAAAQASAAAAGAAAGAQWANVTLARDTAEGRTAIGRENVRTQAAIADYKESEATLKGMEASAASDHPTLYELGTVAGWISPAIANQVAKSQQNLMEAQTRKAKADTMKSSAETGLISTQSQWYGPEASSRITKNYAGATRDISDSMFKVGSSAALLGGF